MWYTNVYLDGSLTYLLAFVNVFSLLFCLFLYFKGRFKPSSTDESVSGNFLFDFYWRTELYPRINSWDLKMFTNCRFGMMSWTILLVSFASKQSELYGLSGGMIVALIIAVFLRWKILLMGKRVFTLHGYHA